MFLLICEKVNHSLVSILEGFKLTVGITIAVERKIHLIF